MILKDETLSFKVSETEREQFMKMCKKNHLTISEMMRLAFSLSWKKLEKIDKGAIRSLLEKPFYL